MIERWGWSSAWASVIWPLRRISSTSEWSRVRRSIFPLAQPVGAAVADVADAHLLVGGVDDRGGDRRPHPGQRGVVVGELGGSRRFAASIVSRRNVSGRAVGQVAVEGVGRGPRGDLPRLGAAHPVGDDEDRGTDEERVLVGAPLAAGVGAECLVVDPEHYVTPPRT